MWGVPTPFPLLLCFSLAPDAGRLIAMRSTSVGRRGPGGGGGGGCRWWPDRIRQDHLSARHIYAGIQQFEVHLVPKPHEASILAVQCFPVKLGHGRQYVCQVLHQVCHQRALIARKHLINPVHLHTVIFGGCGGIDLLSSAFAIIPLLIDPKSAALQPKLCVDLLLSCVTDPVTCIARL